MSITREQIRELAEFQDAKSYAVSFYFQPATPRNKAHKEDTILVKDLVREALRNLESKGSAGKGKESKDKKECARADLDRILRLSGELRSNGTHGKAVFACSAQNLWREYDLPASLPATQLFVDRHRARIFDLRLGELTEREDLFHPQPRRGRSDGYAGYDGGHAQRRVEDEIRQHFKNVAAALKDLLEKGVFEKWILACPDSHRSLLEAQLHSYVSQSLIGRFHADLTHATRDEIRTQAQQIAEGWQADRRRELVGQALSLARS